MTHSPTPAFTLPRTSFKVRSLARRVSQIHDKAMAPAGLRGGQCSLLAHAQRPRGREPPSVTALALAPHTDRTTRTRNLRPLLSAGWVQLGEGTGARRKALQVTSEGEAVLQRARVRWQLAQARVRELAGAEQMTSRQEPA